MKLENFVISPIEAVKEKMFIHRNITTSSVTEIVKVKLKHKGRGIVQH